MLVGLGLAVIVAWAGSQGPNVPARPPHLVLIVVDTLRADHVGCYGNAHGMTPELDALATAGVRFDRVVAQSSWTRPSIGSMITSLHPRSVGLYVERKDSLNDRFETLAEVLRERGYRTVGSTANPNINSTYNFHQGFDHYVDSDVVWRWMGKQDDEKLANRHPLRVAPDVFQSLTDALDEASSKERAQPHFLFANIMEVHEARTPGRFLRPEHRALLPQMRGVQGHYLRAVRQASADVGRFVTELSERPGFEDTVFMIVSDHGEGLRTHGDLRLSRFHGHLLYESHTMVPWILHSPNGARLPRGRVIHHPVRLLDVMPTALDLAGVPGPPTMKGRSLVDLLGPGGPVPVTPPFFVETRFRDHDKVGVYGRRWKYFENRDDRPALPPRELQPMHVAERGAHTDMSAAHPEVASRLRGALEQWEHAHPLTPPTHPDHELSESELSQLRALGYVQ
jgi:arylsulfatase A-like enzyme